MCKKHLSKQVLTLVLGMFDGDRGDLVELNFDGVDNNDKLTHETANVGCKDGRPR